MVFLANRVKKVYQKEIKPNLKKDGKIHVIMINSLSKWLNELGLNCETKYTQEIDQILVWMQEDGCEIIDIKFTTLKNQGIGAAITKREGFQTLIIYK